MIKFCDFLDQQKEYKLADTIIGNLNKTAMKKNHHTEDVSFDKILDLTIKYSQANPKSFMRLAAGPELNFIEIFEFLNKLGFKYEDYLKDISWSEVQRKYEAYKTATKSDPGNLTLQKLYASAKSNGAELLIDKGIVAKMRTMSSTFRTPVGNPTEAPADIANKAKPEVAAVGAAAAASQVSKWKTFCSKLALKFPKFSNQLSLMKNLGGPAVNSIFAYMFVENFINKINTQGVEEAWDSPKDWIEFATMASMVVAAVSGILSGGSMLLSGGTATPFAAAAAACSAFFGKVAVAGFVTDFIGSKTGLLNDPLDKVKGSTKPAALPTKPSKTQSPKPTAKPATKPVNKPTTPSKPQPTQPLRPANPEKEYGGDW